MLNLRLAYIFAGQEPDHQIIEMFPEIKVVFLVAESRSANVGYFVQDHLLLVLNFKPDGNEFSTFPAE